MITKVKRPKVLTYQPAFTQLSRLDFGPELIKKREFEEEMSFGMWHGLGGWKGLEVQVRWYNWGSKLKLAMVNQLNLERQKRSHPQVFALLEDDNLQPDDLRLKLLQLGYADVNDFQ